MIANPQCRGEAFSFIVPPPVKSERLQHPNQWPNRKEGVPNVGLVLGLSVLQCTRYVVRLDPSFLRRLLSPYEVRDRSHLTLFIQFLWNSGVELRLSLMEKRLGTLFVVKESSLEPLNGLERGCFWHLENCIASTLSWILYIQVIKGQR